MLCAHALLDAGAVIEKPDFMYNTPLETWISKPSWDFWDSFLLLLKKNVEVNKLNKAASFAFEKNRSLLSGHTTANLQGNNA